MANNEGNILLGYLSNFLWVKYNTKYKVHTVLPGPQRIDEKAESNSDWHEKNETIQYELYRIYYNIVLMTRIEFFQETMVK